MFNVQLRAILGGPPGLTGREQRLTFCQPQLRQILTELVGITTIGGISSYPLRSFSQPFSFSEDTVESDLVESSYPGYDGSFYPLTWSVGRDLYGRDVAFSDQTPPFQCTGDPAGEMVYGFYLFDTAQEFVIAGCSLDTPIALASGTVIPVALIIQVGNST